MSRLPNGWAFDDAARGAPEAAPLPQDGNGGTAAADLVPELPSRLQGPLSWMDPPGGDISSLSEVGHLGGDSLAGVASLLGADMSSVSRVGQLGGDSLGGGVSLLGFSSVPGGEPTSSPGALGRHTADSGLDSPSPSPGHGAGRAPRYGGPRTSAGGLCSAVCGSAAAHDDVRSDEEDLEPRDLANASWSTDDTGMLPQRPSFAEVHRPLAVPRLDLAVVAATSSGADSGEGSEASELGDEDVAWQVGEALEAGDERSEGLRWTGEASQGLDAVAAAGESGGASEAALPSVAAVVAPWGADCLTPEVPALPGLCGSLSGTQSTRAASTPPFAVAATPTPPYAGRSPMMLYEPGCESQTSPGPTHLHLSPPW